MPLFILAAVVCMYGLRELEPLVSGQDQALLTLALVGLQIVLVSLAALLMGRRALARLEQDSKQQGPMGGIYRRLSLVMNIVVLAMFAGDIYLAGWADLATAAVQRAPVLLDELLILLPLLISWIIVQALLYGLDRAVMAVPKPAKPDKPQPKDRRTGNTKSKKKGEADGKDKRQLNGQKTDV